MNSSSHTFHSGMPIPQVRQAIRIGLLVKWRKLLCMSQHTPQNLVCFWKVIQSCWKWCLFNFSLNWSAIKVPQVIRHLQNHFFFNPSVLYMPSLGYQVNEVAGEICRCVPTNGSYTDASRSHILGAHIVTSILQNTLTF